MKPMNFPGRVQRRQYEAAMRKNSSNQYSVSMLEKRPKEYDATIKAIAKGPA